MINNKFTKYINALSINRSINKIIEDKEYEKLLEYNRFDWSYIKDIYGLIKNIDSKIFMHIINNTINLEYKNKKDNRSLMHYACIFHTIEIIQLLINKNVNLECEDPNKWRPIHYACKYNTLDVIQLLIDKNVNLE